MPWVGWSSVGARRLRAGGVGPHRRRLHEGGHALGDDGVDDPLGAPDVDPVHLVRVVRGLQQEREVDDDVGPAEHLAEVPLRDVDRGPLDAGVTVGRQPPGEPDDRGDLGEESSWGRSCEPTLPVAPVTTMRMGCSCPGCGPLDLGHPC